jgi:periplasmic copper chaperone A
MPTQKLRRVAMGAALGLLASPLVFAHVVLETKTAPVNSEFKAAFQVGHGCAGRATTAIEVTLPADITVGPAPTKAGWTVSVQRAQLAEGSSAAQGTRVTWSGGPLAHDAFDQFEMLIRTPATPGTRYFRVLQRCGDVSTDWSEIPAPGQSRRELKRPAAHLDVVPAL